MKKLLVTLLAMCAAQTVLADDEMVTLIDTMPSQFASEFNRLNQAEGKGAYSSIRLDNADDDRSFNLAPNITLKISTYTDGIEYIDLICKKPKQTAERCVLAMPLIGKAIDPHFNTRAFYSLTQNIDIGVSTAYRQNGVEYHVIPDLKRKELRMEIQAED